MRMCALRRSSVALIACFAFAPSLASQEQSRSIGGVGVSVWKDANFRGENSTFRNDVPDLASYGFRRSISSLRVEPGETWEGCEQVNYGGNCQVFSGSEPDLLRRGWNDRIVSIRRVRNGNGRGFGDTGDIVLSSEANGRGEQRRYSQAVRDLRAEGFDHRAMSLQVMRGGWEVCQFANFQSCVTVTGTVPDLSSIDYARRISSIRPIRGGGFDQAFEAARQACTTELGRHGWHVEGPPAPTRNGRSIAMEIRVRGSIRDQTAVARCTYDPQSGTAQVQF